MRYAALLLLTSCINTPEPNPEPTPPDGGVCLPAGTSCNEGAECCSGTCETLDEGRFCFMDDGRWVCVAHCR